MEGWHACHGKSWNLDQQHVVVAAMLRMDASMGGCMAECVGERDAGWLFLEKPPGQPENVPPTGELDGGLCSHCGEMQS